MPDFDILGTNAGGLGGQPQIRGAFNSVPLAGQGQQPMSGLMAGILGVPTTGGAVPGAAYPMQGQGQAYGGQGQQTGGLMAGILGAYPSAAQLYGAQPQSGATAPNIGSGVGNLLNGIINNAQSRDV